jgi:hypothetical protein
MVKMLWHERRAGLAYGSFASFCRRYSKVRAIASGVDTNGLHPKAWSFRLSNLFPPQAAAAL